MKVAALYVAARGAYFGLEDVDPWDEVRDARKYTGPYPVVAHPPCGAYCRLAKLREVVHGLPMGEDGGCFESALAAVRTYGGVLEHPAFSDAWTKYELPVPTRGGWQRGLCGGWACHVEQSQYGHPARKATWLYYFGRNPPPALDWKTSSDTPGYCGPPDTGSKPTTSAGEWRRRLSKAASKATPIRFRDQLLSIARAANFA